MAKNLISVTGRNLALVVEQNGKDPWTSSLARVREALREREMVEVPEADGLLCFYLSKPLTLQHRAHYNWMKEEVLQFTTLTDYLCIS